MFNNTYKKEAQERLNQALEKHEKACKSLKNAARNLYQMRVKKGLETIQQCENYINSLANTPQELSNAIAELKFQRNEVIAQDWELICLDFNKNVITESTASQKEVMTKAELAYFKPAVALSITPTLGITSTGTVIASLSGTAATNAVLARLGSNALTTGHNEIAASNWLASTGLMGWAVGGVALAGTAFWVNQENKKIGTEATNQALKIEGETIKVNIIKLKVNRLEQETTKLTGLIASELQYFEQNAPLNYSDFSLSLQQRLTTLINSIDSLSRTLTKTVSLKG